MSLDRIADWLVAGWHLADLAWGFLAERPLFAVNVGVGLLIMLTVGIVPWAVLWRQRRRRRKDTRRELLSWALRYAKSLPRLESGWRDLDEIRRGGSP